MPEISVIVTFYNAKKYALSCLESIKKQSFQDFECICIDDGSCDDTLKLLTDFAKTDLRFIVLTQKNSGVSSARNLGLDSAKGEFVAFIDHDDLFHPQALEAMHHIIKTENSDISYVGYKKVSDNFKLNNAKCYNYKSFKILRINNPGALYKNAGVTIWNKLYKKDLLRDIRFTLDVHPGEDLLFTAKVMAKSKLVAGSYDEGLYFYRNSSTSVMRAGVTEKYIKSYYLAAMDMYDYFSNSADSENIIKSINNVLIYRYCIKQPLQCKDLEKIELAFDLVKDLYERKIFSFKYLTLKRRLITSLFFSKRYKLASLLIVI